MRRRLVDLGAAAAVIAGLCWVAKAASILVTGEQPALLYAAAFLFFPLAVVGLYAALPASAARVRAARAGVGLAVVTEVAAVGLVLATAFGPAAWEPRDDTVTVLTPLYALSGVGPFAALFMVGLGVHHHHGLPGRVRSLPLATALAAVPLLGLGWLLSLIEERLVEVPVLVLGAAWLAIGLASARRTTAGARMATG